MNILRIYFVQTKENAPDEAVRWLLSKIRAQPPAGLGLHTSVKLHETSKSTALYISAPSNMYVYIYIYSVFLYTFSIDSNTKHAHPLSTHPVPIA